MRTRLFIVYLDKGLPLLPIHASICARAATLSVTLFAKRPTRVIAESGHYSSLAMSLKKATISETRLSPMPVLVARPNACLVPEEIMDGTPMASAMCE